VLKGASLVAFILSQTGCKYLTIMLLLFYYSKTYDLLSMYDWCLLLRPLQQGVVPLARGAGAK